MKPNHHRIPTLPAWAAKLLMLVAVLCPLSAALAVGPPPPPDGPGPTNFLLSTWSFTDTNTWVTDTNRLTHIPYPPVSFTNLGVSDLGNGNALVLDSPAPAWLQYQAIEDDGSTNLPVGPAGSLMFWFAPFWSSTSAGGAGPGEWGRLIEVGSYTPDSSYGWWSLYVDDGGNNLYFSAQTNDFSSNVWTYLSAPISWTTNMWHLLAITYSPTSSSLYIDGELATNGPPVTCWPGPDVLAEGFYLGSDSTGVVQAKGMFDEMATYANPVDSNTVASAFYGEQVPYYLNPENVANLSPAPFYMTNDPVFRAVMGPGYLTYLGPVNLCVTNARVWITNVMARLQTNGTESVSFTVTGGDPNVVYDVFGTTSLYGTNIAGAQWYWLGQVTTCGWYSLTNLPGGNACLVLGTDRDSDGDGLTDAYELLVSKTDPHNPDTDGDGIPDWFGVVYFGGQPFDPWASPQGDGWNIFEKYLYGLPIGQFDTPPAPRNFTVSLNQPAGTASLSWEPPPGAVTGYTLTRFDSFYVDVQTFNLGVSTQFVDLHFPTITPDIMWDYYQYELVAHYQQGVDSNPVESMPLPLTGGLEVYTLAGPMGTTLMRATHVPAGASGLCLAMLDSNGSGGYYVVTNYTFPISLFTNAFFTLPSAWTVPGPYGSAYRAQAVWPDGSLGGSVPAGYPVPAFYDGRQQLAQNLAFVLRAADVAGPFSFQSAGYLNNNGPVTSPSTYAYAGLAGGSSTGSSLTGAPSDASTYGFNPTLPFEDNCLYCNFVFNTTNMFGGWLATGVWWDDVNGDLVPANLLYSFQMPTNGVFPSYLSPAATTWIVPHYTPSLLSLSVNSTNSYTVQQNVVNWYGLPLLSVEFTGSSYVTATPGQSVAQTNANSFFANFAQPSLSTSGYLFGGSAYRPYHDWGIAQGPLPGDSDFTTASPQPVLVAPVGFDYQAVAYARQTIGNGDHSKPAFLGQYFESAFQVDTNGQVTANPTGILSPYGDFFPTNVGAVALVTMTNWGVNERGTGILYVVSLATDLNRDGVIDPTFFGPDQTTPDHPFRFWVNDFNDSGDDQGSGIPGQGDGGTGLFLFQANAAIYGTRSLVNFFPVQVCIQSLLNRVPSLSTLTFKLRHDQSALYYLETDLTPDHCHDYLTDINFLSSLPSYMGSASRVWNTGVALSTNFLAKIRDQGKGIILVEAGQATSSPLMLEVWQGTNLLAQAPLYLSISEVEQMFRQKNLIRETFPSTAELPGFGDRLTTGDGWSKDPGFAWNEPDTNEKNFVFVHGYSVDPNRARGFFADTFKRLFWSGSHARFYGVTWRGNESQPPLLTIAPDYHTNVANAFLSAPNLAAFLGTLTNGPTTVVAHSLGNMVALSALSDYNARMSNYFMLDAAVPMEAIDGGAVPDFHMRHSTWASPEDYATRLYASGWWTLFANNDARSTLTWSNRLGNFRTTQVYNFYSSGEEVLREYDDDPPVSAFGLATLLTYWTIHPPLSSFVWVWQEKAKGVSPLNTVLGSTHGGWKFNTNAPYYFTTNGTLTHMPNSQASVLSAVQLETNAFFDMSFDAPLFTAGNTGSNYAQTNRNRILSDAIPAMTWAVGANALPDSGVVVQDFDMQLLYENGWPSGRGPALWPTGSPAFGEWHHSDFRQVAYTFTYQLFDSLVNLGQLK
ncbi:MAG TPA: LamG-like jellyroll fold domain-containing protein [Candidatus Acidoferrum sp.]|nr:LamG-like jellyroll fold domain-containing protein [Candidatus Acidoferrum sp.]